MRAEQELEWSLGPVQSFIAAARRTRDLWGGSYLLSLLVAEAIAASGLATDAFVVPSPGVVDRDPLVKACRLRRSGGEPPAPLPRCGGLPNHVRVVVEEGQAADVAQRMSEAVQHLWQVLSEAVWKEFVAHAASAPGRKKVRTIWERQISSCWELSWVVGQPREAALRRRKLWRTHLLPVEPGDRCMVQPEYQELSGELASTGREARQRQQQFWADVRKKAGDYNVRPDERLCAPVLVKRLWPEVATEAGLAKPDSTRWPSTLHLALAPWIQTAAESAPDLADELKISLSSTIAKPAVVRDQKAPLPGLGPHVLWSLDPDLLLDQDISQRNDEIGRILGILRQKLGAPSPFYGVVLADGDRLGELVGTLGTKVVGKALAQFADNAQGVADDVHAVLVYAGGDDVLALAPVAGALELAEGLSLAYKQSFEQMPEMKDKAVRPTLSAAVVFAHARNPLVEVLASARYLLDEVAKEGNGRASVAVSLRRRGGESARWVRAFEADGRRSLKQLQALADYLRPQTAPPGRRAGGPAGKMALANDLRAQHAPGAAALYRVAKVVGGLLCPAPSAVGERGSLVLGDLAVLTALVASELARSKTGPSTGQDNGEIAQVLVELMTEATGPSRTDGGQPQLGVDLVPLLRFLATGGARE